jgi:hypothetical protein
MQDIGGLSQLEETSLPAFFFSSKIALNNPT